MCRLELSKLCPEQHEKPCRRRARNGRGATPVSENCDLTKEVARREYRQRLALGRDRCRSLDEDEERVAGRAFADKPDALTRVLDVEPVRKLRKLLLVKRVKSGTVARSSTLAIASTLSGRLLFVDSGHHIVTAPDVAMAASPALAAKPEPWHHGPVQDLISTGGDSCVFDSSFSLPPPASP